MMTGAQGTKGRRILVPVERLFMARGGARQDGPVVPTWEAAPGCALIRE